MTRGSRIVATALGGALAVLFVREMLAHYGNGGASSGRGIQPSVLPGALGDVPPDSPGDSVAVEVRPDRSAIDSVFTADVVLTNRKSVAIDRVTIRCHGLSERGDTIGHATAVLTRTFAARATIAVPRVELPFTHPPTRARCVVASFELAR